jgi:hypothetical protein
MITNSKLTSAAQRTFGAKAIPVIFSNGWGLLSIRKIKAIKVVITEF